MRLYIKQKRGGKKHGKEMQRLYTSRKLGTAYGESVCNYFFDTGKLRGGTAKDCTHRCTDKKKLAAIKREAGKRREIVI